MKYIINSFLILLTLFFIRLSAETSPQCTQGRYLTPASENFDCYSPSIVETAPGIFCVVWKGGPGEGISTETIKKNVGIWLTRCVNGEWETPREIVTSPDSVCWNPTLVKTPSGELLLFYRVGDNPRHLLGVIKRSLDGGVNWAEDQVLPAGIQGPTKAKPIFDTLGNMICGSSVESGEPEQKLRATSCWIEISPDNGHSWLNRYGPLEIPGKRFGAIEPALFKGENGSLKLLCRDRANRIGGHDGSIWTATSKDQGKNWSPLVRTSLPNPDSALDLLELGNGKILLFFNNSSTERIPLTMALSEDYGNGWHPVIDIDNESGEYPSAILGADGLVHLVYAKTVQGHEQRRIIYRTIDLRRIEK